MRIKCYLLGLPGVRLNIRVIIRLHLSDLVLIVGITIIIFSMGKHNRIHTEALTGSCSQAFNGLNFEYRCVTPSFSKDSEAALLKNSDTKFPIYSSAASD